MRIIGTGSALPELVVKNDDLAAFLDTSDEWITTRTGIRERRIHEGNLDELAAAAASRAMDSAGLTARDIDFLLCSNSYNRYMTPALSCVIEGMIGAACPCFDINAACAGFVYALETADSLLASGRYRNILIICAEEPTRMTDWTDRSTCVLFGDAAAAVVVTSGGGDFYFKTATAPNTEILHAYNSPGNCPYEKTSRRHTPIYMNGQEVYKNAVSSAAEDIRMICQGYGTEPDSVDYFVLHQANLRIIEAVRARLSQPEEKFPHNLERCGNTSSASIPLLLDSMNRGGGLKHGSLLALSAFGAGFTTGTCLFKW